MKETFTRAESWFRQKLRRWLRQNPRTLRTLRRFRCFSTDNESMSRGLAIGLFFGLTPTVGFQTSLVLPSCLLLRGNFPVAFAATWVSNPLTMGPLYLVFNWLGERMIGSSILSPATADAYPLLNVFAGETMQILVGCLPIALPAAFLGYLAGRTLGRKRLKSTSIE